MTTSAREDTLVLMVENLEFLIQQAAGQPEHPRGGLYKELLRSQTFLLCVDKPLKEGVESRVSRGSRDFAVWADRDPELGGVWVPVFPARDEVGEFVKARGLRPPKGKEFLWMEHRPGEVFSLLRGVRYFAGLRLYLDDSTQVAVPWTLVKSLSDGRVPEDGPERYELPVSRLVIPEGVRVSYDEVALGDGGAPGRLLRLPAAGKFAADDLRKLVRLNLGRHGVVWMACRHFLQVLRYTGGDAGRCVEDILRSFIGFEMFGEAEALCEWLARKGNEAFAWVCQAAIYGRTGRLSECAALCRRAAAKYPAERSFRVNGARALAALGRREEARQFARLGLEAVPDDAALTALLKDLEGKPGESR
ncbi:MAG: hypothetical protein PHF00_01035 [Elusimicrobia bacterium]|nr:hypothetical protein [Elusimicrobiota bacterium]